MRLYGYAGSRERLLLAPAYHGCENKIEESVPKITVWHHKACWAMTNDDPCLFALLDTLLPMKGSAMA